MDPWAAEPAQAADHWTVDPLNPDLINHPIPVSKHIQNHSSWHSLSLPNWDSPSHSDSTLPSSTHHHLPPLSPQPHSSPPLLLPAPISLPPTTSPSWSDSHSSHSFQNSPTNPLPSPNHLVPDQSDSSPQSASLTIPSHSPTDSDHSLFKTPQGSVHNWSNTPSSSIQPPSIQPPSTPLQLDLSPSLSLPPHPEPDPDNDDDRWGTFTHTPVLPTSSALPFSSPPDIPSQSPTQPGWQADPGFGGWDSNANIDAVALSLDTSAGQHDGEQQLQKGWLTSTPDNPLDQIKVDQDHPPVEDVEDAWADTKPREVHEVPSDIVGKHQLAAQKWAQDQWPVQEENFLPPGKAAMPLNLSSALSPGGELAGTLADLTQDPLPETSATRTQLLFQNSATAEAFQHAISKTAAAAATVLKSANRSRRLFPMGAQSCSPSLQDTTSLPSTGQPSAEDAIWNDFSALEVPHHPHDADSDVFGLYESQQTVQQQQSKRSSFFGLWTAKSPTPTNTPATLLTKKADDGLIGSPPVAGLAVTPKQSLSLSRDTTSSPNTSPSGGLRPSSSGPSESPQDPPPSRISRLFGRFGTRPTHASINSPEKPSFNDLTTAPTELDEREASYLDAAQTVPVEPLPGPYDAVPPIHGLKLDVAPPHQPEPGGDLLDFLTDHAQPALVPPRRHSREMSGQKPRQVPRDPFDFFDAPTSRARPPQPPQRRFSKSTPDVPSMGPLSLIDALSGSSTGLVSLSQQTHSSGAAPRAPATASQPTDDLDTLFSHFETPMSSSSSVQRSAGGGWSQAPAITGAVGKKAWAPVGGAGVTTVRMAAGVGGQDGGGAGTGRVPVLAPPPGTSCVPLIPPPQRTQDMGSLNDEGARNVGGRQVRFEVNQGTAVAAATGGRGSFMYDGSGGPNNGYSSQKHGVGNLSQAHKSNVGGGGLSKQDLSFFESLM